MTNFIASLIAAGFTSADYADTCWVNDDGNSAYLNEDGTVDVTIDVNYEYDAVTVDEAAELLF